MGVKLYNLSDSPPCLMVRMGLKYLGVEYEIVEVDFMKGEQFSKEFLEKNPQGEVPVLDDNGFLIHESAAILQYIADKYKKDDTFYPSDLQKRALINQRLAFHLSTYYKAVVNYIILPAAYAYAQTESDKKLLDNALGVFDTILARQGANKYVAGPNLTIADIPLFMATVCLEIVNFDKEGKYKNVKAWYDHFKQAHPELWVYGKICYDELGEFIRNPPDFSKLNHPKFPTDKSILNK